MSCGEGEGGGGCKSVKVFFRKTSSDWLEGRGRGRRREGYLVGAGAHWKIEQEKKSAFTLLICFCFNLQATKFRRAHTYAFPGSRGIIRVAHSYSLYTASSFLGHAARHVIISQEFGKWGGGSTHYLLTKLSYAHEKNQSIELWTCIKT